MGREPAGARVPHLQPQTSQRGLGVFRVCRLEEVEGLPFRPFAFMGGAQLQRGDDEEASPHSALLRVGSVWAFWRGGQERRARGEERRTGGENERGEETRRAMEVGGLESRGGQGVRLGSAGR